MSLLQISEPNDTVVLNSPSHAIGIDLGTTYSLVATIQNDQAVCLPDDNGQILLPSAVHYMADGSCEVGYDALSAQNADPCNTITSIKRLMGRSVGDLDEVDTLPYRFVNAPGMLRIITPATPKSPVEVSATILKTLRQRAEKILGGDLSGAVITVPAYFDDAQRQATKDAAELAGIKVLRLLNEPTAAAIAYGLDNQSQGLFLIYDLGGGTFDVSILRLSRGLFEVIATHGNASLGGDDFDQRIYCWILEASGLSKLAPNDARQVLTGARLAKEKLTQQDAVPLSITLSNQQTISLTLTLNIFEHITQTLVDKTLSAVALALGDAKVGIDEIDGIVMVGGATRMPSIRRAMSTYCAQPLLINLDPEKVVAMGAAIQADILAGNRKTDWLLLDVIPLSLGIETMGGLVEKIIPRNSTIPVSRTQEFTTYQDGQNGMIIHVLQGERELVSNCRSLACFTLSNIPVMKAGKARVRVTFEVDADGMLSVSAHELSCNIKATVAVKPTYGLSEDDTERILNESLNYLHEDIHARRRCEAILNAQTLLKNVQDAMLSDADLLDKNEYDRIILVMKQLDHLLQTGQSTAQINNAQAQLTEATDHFAILRMDRSIQEALKGKTIDMMEPKEN